MQSCFSFEKDSGTQRVAENSVGEEWCSLYKEKKRFQNAILACVLLRKNF
jgi:hypothetical protein